MKQFKPLIFLLAPFVVMWGCQENLPIGKNSGVGIPPNGRLMLNSEESVYNKYFNHNQGGLYFAHEGGSYRIKGFFDIVRKNRPSAEAPYNALYSEIGPAQIADVEMISRPERGYLYISGLDRKAEEEKIKSLFGNIITFRIGKEEAVARQEAAVHSMYIPHELQFENIVREEFTLPHVDGSNNAFTFQWNADAQNKNGVIVVVESHARTSTQTTDSTPKIIEVVDDIGSYSLPIHFMEVLPDSAKIRIDLYRGNIENLLIGEKEYSVYGFSQAGQYFIVNK
ncbi:hypothetical protein [Tunicatimonas pelagia]|uniref:hypothetical protein n=1 Tax=Tunicatimonas pelagia TaxID=931531 RepID=UPI0026669D98|nr:hypothetical protein [Tunicatimonas pelagia]WKN41504.1 hypothetical protein P0M28_20930 [Tunicatimonas pelagia]